MNLLQRYAMYHHRQVMAIYQIYIQIDAALPVMGCLAGRLYRIEIGISKRPVRFEDFQLNVCHFLGQLDKKRMPIPRLVYAAGGMRLPIEKATIVIFRRHFFPHLTIFSAKSDPLSTDMIR